MDDWVTFEKKMVAIIITEAKTASEKCKLNWEKAPFSQTHLTQKLFKLLVEFAFFSQTANW